MSDVFVVTRCGLSDELDRALVNDLVRFGALGGETDQWIVIHPHREVPIKDGKKEDYDDMHGEIQLELLGSARAELDIESLEESGPPSAANFLH